MRSAALALLVLSLACAKSQGEASDAGVDPGNRVDVPLLGIDPDSRTAFNDGDSQFDTPFYPADGLGPVYVATSCGACHEDGQRGPGIDQRMVMMNADGSAPLEDQSALPWGHEVRSLVTAGATHPVQPPDAGNVLVTTRVPPIILGRGYMEAIEDSEILRVESEQAARTDGIHGIANRVTYTSELSADTKFSNYKKGDAAIGRFGLKARIATLDDFTADALQNDMGITSPLRPVELPNPDGLTDDQKPGVDTDTALVARLALYMRLTDIPTRLAPDAHGQQLFDTLKCSICHAPSLKTRADYPIPQLANIDAPIYSDLLLHDMGAAFADGMVEFSAGSTQFRTTPLIGERFLKAFLHDGRVHAVADAIAQHGGEAKASADGYAALSRDDQAALVAFVSSL